MGYHPGDIGHRLQRHANRLLERSFLSCYRSLLSHVSCPAEHVVGAREPDTILSVGTDLEECFDLYQLMSFVDLVTYLPDDILVKVDRASMAVSLEARVPVLDHRVVEFAARIPSHWKYRNGKGKWLLRRVLNRHVPAALTERPKMGFGVPIDSWLRVSLREWGEELLSEPRLIAEGYLDARRVRALWAEHIEGKRNWAYYLWVALMFQAWLEHS
jgi:asparagine synthase (glutamine-hydrolysing)